MEGEQIILSSDTEALVLTSKRVRYSSTAFGNASLVSITLDAVASCGFITKSNPIALVVAAILFVLAIVERGQIQLLLVIFAILCVVAFVLTRRAVLSISSNGGHSIVVPANGMSSDVLTRFIDTLENQKMGEAGVVASMPIPNDIVERSQIPMPEFDMPRCPQCRAADPVLIETEPSNKWLCESCRHEWNETAVADAEG